MIKKRNTGTGERRTGLLVTLVVAILLLLGGVGAGCGYAYSFFSAIWHEQCRVNDCDLDVVILTGKMVHPEVITYQFGLTNGANLATIPFAELREDLLKRSPNVRDVKIERRLPNRVTLEVVERVPLARIATKKGSVAEGRVADAEGVVFWYNPAATATQLPIVRESTDAPTPTGKKLTGMAAAALRLVETAALPELADLRVLEIDTSHSDYLYVTLGNHDHAQIAWERMHDDSRTARLSLQKQLRHLSKVIEAHLTPHATVWLATDWGPHSRITASGPNNRAGN